MRTRFSLNSCRPVLASSLVLGFALFTATPVQARYHSQTQTSNTPPQETSNTTPQNSTTEEAAPAPALATYTTASNTTPPATQTSPSSPPAQSSGTIQFLPPTDYAGNTCNGTTAGVLAWDGSNSLHCVPGSRGDESGNIQFNGMMHPGHVGHKDHDCSSEGAFAYDQDNHMPVYCDQNKHWSACGGGTGWVTVSACADGSPNLVYAGGIYQGLNWCESSLSVQQICQNAGYANYTGACQGIYNDGNGFHTVQGTLGNSQITGQPWALGCLLGSQASQGTARNLQILCSH